MGKILVIRGGAIGDFILTLPAIRLLKEELPDAELEIMGYESILSLAVAGGYAKKTRSIEYGPMAAFFAPGAALDPDLCAYFASFDVVVSYLYDPDHFFRGNLERAGVETLIECSHRVDNEGEAASRQLAKPLEQLALFLDDDRAAPWLELAPAHHQQAKEFLTDPVIPLIGLHPGSGSPYKNWDLDNWLAVMRTLHRLRPDAKFLISTGEAEEEKVTTFLNQVCAESLPAIHADSLALPLLGALLCRCQCFLGHDSGISHLAAAVGTPSVVLFGPTMSSVWAPPHQHVQILEHPSGLLSEITVDQVVARAAKTGEI